MECTLPVVVWNRPPLHDVELVAPSVSGEFVVTSASSGELCIWRLTPSSTDGEGSGAATSSLGRTADEAPASLTVGAAPWALLVVPGGAPVVAVACGIIEWGKEVVLSIEADGSCCLWSIQDGMCLVNRRRLLPLCATRYTAVSFATRSYVAVGGNSQWLAAIHLPTLSLVHTMNGHSEWLCSMVDFAWEVLHPVSRRASPQVAMRKQRGSAARAKTLTIGQASGERRGAAEAPQARRNDDDGGDGAGGGGSGARGKWAPGAMCQKVMGLLTLTRDDCFHRWRLDEKRKICVSTKIAHLRWSGPSTGAAVRDAAEREGNDAPGEAPATHAAKKRWEWKDWRDPEEASAAAASDAAAADAAPRSWRDETPRTAQCGFRTLAIAPGGAAVVVVGGSRWGVLDGAELDALRAPVEWSADGSAAGQRPTIVPQRQSGPPPQRGDGASAESAAWGASMAADFTLGITGGNAAAPAWVGAEFVTSTAVVLWDSDGRAFAFDIAPAAVPSTAAESASASLSADAGAVDRGALVGVTGTGGADLAGDTCAGGAAAEAAAAAAGERGASGITLLCRLDRCRSAAERAAAAGGGAPRQRRVVPLCALRCSLPVALRRGQPSTFVPLVIGANAASDGVATWMWSGTSNCAPGEGAGAARCSFASSAVSIGAGWPQLAPAPPLRAILDGAAQSGGETKVEGGTCAALRVTCAASLLISSGAAQPWTSRDTLLVARMHVDPLTWVSSLTLLQMPLSPNSSAVVLDAALCAARPGACVTCIAFLPQRGELHATNVATGDPTRRTRCHFVTGDSDGVVCVWELRVACAALLAEARRGAANSTRGVKGDGNSSSSGAAVDAVRTISSASLLSSMQLHDSAVVSLSVAPADAPPLFASVGGDRAVVVYRYAPPSLNAKFAVVLGVQSGAGGGGTPARDALPSRAAAAAAAAAAGNVWRPRQSKRDGRTYYVNVATRETTWTLSADAVVLDANGKRVPDVSDAVASDAIASDAIAGAVAGKASGGASPARPGRNAPGLVINATAPLSERAASVRAALQNASVRASSKVPSIALRAPGHMAVGVQCTLRGHGSAVHAVAWQQWRAGLVIVSCASGESIAWNLVSGVLERRVPSEALRGEHFGFGGDDILAAGDAARGGARAAPERSAAQLRSQDIALAQQRERSAIAAPREGLCPTAHGGAGRVGGLCGGARFDAASYERGLGKAYGGASRAASRAASGRSTHAEGGDVAIGGVIAASALAARSIAFSDSSDAEADETRDVVDVQRGRAHCLRLHIGALADELKLRRNTGASELAYLLAWGLEPEVDAVCTSVLQLRSPREDGAATAQSSVTSFGLVGAGGALSMCPPSAASGSRRWNYSPRLTALHSLALVSLFMTLMAPKAAAASASRAAATAKAFSRLITHYAVIFPEGMRKQKRYVEPELPFYARLALSVWEEGHVAARLLLQCTVERMPKEARVAAAYMWAARLQLIAEQREASTRAATAASRVKGGGGGGAVSAAAIAKGAAESAGASKRSPGAPRVSRKALPSSADARSALAARRLRRAGDAFVAATELEVMVVVLSVVGVTNHTDLSPATARPIARVLMNFLRTGSPERAAFAADMLGKGFVLWRPYLDGSLQGLVRTLLRRALQASPASDGSDSAQKKGSVASAAQRALMELGSSEPGQFLQTCGREALRAGAGPRYHCTALMALVALVSKRPAALLRFLPDVVTAVIRTLDPSEPDQRKGCLRASTRALHELVKQYPMVSFHQESQRYAVGTLSSVIVIFDLRTATKWRMLEGHKHALTAVAFVASGEMLASYSAEERALKLWRSGAKGFMAQMLSVTSRCQNTIALRPIKEAEKISPARALGTVKLNWISPRVVHLVREDGSSVTEQLK